MKRRRFCLTAGSALGLACLRPGVARSAATEGAPTLAGMHDMVARAARELAEGRDIELTILLPQGSTANVKAASNAFTQATGVTIRFSETPVDEINSRMIVDTISGTNSFDLALPATFGLPDLVEAGAITNLDDFATKYEPSQFQATALFSLGDYYKDSLYGYQSDGDAYLMFYNRDWLRNPEDQKRFADRHGYPLQIPETWDQLDTTMKYFHRPEEGRHGGALFRTPNYIAWEYWIRFHAKGYWPFDENLVPQIDNDAGVAALEELIAASNSLYPDARTNGLFENWEAFSKGNIFCNIGWGGTQKFLNGENSQVRGRLAFGPTPGGYVGDQLLVVPYFNWGWNYTVSSGSKNPEIAYLFALYACSPVMSTKAVREEGGFFDPFRSEHYSDPQIIKAYSEEFLSAHRESMTRSIPDLYLRGQGEYFDALRENLVLADTGAVTAREALKRTAQQWQHTTRRLGRRSQIEQWTFLRSRYPQAVRRLLV